MGVPPQKPLSPGDVLPNGQTADPNTNLEACLDAVKDIYYKYPYAGIACGFKNAGTGMGKKDIGRVLLSIEKGKDPYPHLRILYGTGNRPDDP